MRCLKKIIAVIMLSVMIFSVNTVEFKADNGTGNTSDIDEVPTVSMKAAVLSKNVIKSGDMVTIKATVVNTAKKAEAKNVYVSAAVESEFLQITGKTDRVSLGQLKAAESKDASFTLSTKSTTPTGVYDVNITIDYGDKDGNPYSVTDKVRVTVGQRMKVKFDPIIIDSEAKAGDTIPASVNAMNFGNSRLCNVRAQISGDGLKSKGTLYIGDIEPGQMGSGSVEILVSPMTKGANKYGVTKGKVTYYYETEFGKKKKRTETFSLKIKKKDKDVSKKDGEDQTKPTFQPKIIVDSYKISKENVYAGEEFNVNITIRNTNSSMSVKNLMVTAGIENEFLKLKSKSDSIFVDEIPAAGSTTVSYTLSSGSATPTGQYELKLSMGYADKEGNTYDSTGQVKINITQKSKLKVDNLIISKEAEIGDTIEAGIKAMNLGNEKIKNVRAEIKADGLTPKGTLFIGDIEAGQAGEASVEVTVGSLKESDSEYGESNGVVTYYYENEDGREQKIEQEFTISIKELTIPQNDDTTRKSNQWWIAIAVVVVLLLGFSGYGIYRKLYRKTREQ